jgi:RNA polymerase sigma-70 factor (sigma-E family)
MVGDESGSAFEAFARAEGPRLVRLARLLCGNDHDAWDVVQETLIRIGRRWRSIDSERNPSAYARKCLINVNRNRMRRLGREVLVESVPERIDDSRDSVDGPDAWLDAALQRLPWKQRAAVTLAYYEDLPVHDISVVLDCSVSAVKTHLARGRQALRAAADAHRAGEVVDGKQPPRSADGNR